MGNTTIPIRPAAVVGAIPPARATAGPSTAAPAAWRPRRRARREDLSVFDGVAPFDGLSRRARRALAPHVDRLRLPAGAVLAEERQVAREVAVVIAGEVVARRRSDQLGRSGPGTRIGASALLRGEAHAATVVAVTDVELLVVNGPAYRWVARDGLVDDGPAPAA